MASFDIVSKVDLQTLDNAVNTAKREVDTRYDLRGSNSEIELDKKALSIRISTEDNMKLEAIEKILLERSSKQQIDVKSYDLSQEPQPSGKLIIKTIRVQQGIDREKAKRIVKAIKDSKLKVQPQIMDDMVRVNGKKIDDLQAVIALCKEQDFDVPLQYENMKS
ncbi:MAG: YajQ family cyclic di-GMP-binding protein [Flavobacteriales bacterium]|nr:YajQ family cyclic di-GMP-binding protein [Flavobacteriales bacterium]MCB0817720.1 YajQ family cyclic di-GMP-binding protein [Flavobacteriales bacterium]MCB9179873.1 YajQ family cyclic di-GMP-binding protein [Flavobacteriales bacterium]MCB9200966.1 YajQ family cyclic di-GMP-binding protein [Flavobacteriales bacterium]HPJ52607.1 YajQ family cyclic di-GMP-binding protein [Flavobacteriales bacterium]